jgi:predicted glutamine amidotransferase
MARLFGLIGNRADIGGRVFGLESEALSVQSRGAPLGWGMGFYQGGEVLMRRRPVDDREVIDVAKLAADVRGDVLIGHVRSATVGALRTENTHPFRYRQWLFAQTGTVPHFDGIRDRLLESIPGFLRSGIRGETDAEIFFHVFLSFLHDAGRLQDNPVEPTAVREAIRSSLAVIDTTTAEVGGGPAAINLLLTDGEHLFGLHRNEQMCLRSFSGKHDADLIIGEDPQLRRRAPELAHMRFTVIASDFDSQVPPRWKPVEQRAIVTLSRVAEPHIDVL